MRTTLKMACTSAFWLDALLRDPGESGVSGAETLGGPCSSTISNSLSSRRSRPADSRATACADLGPGTSHGSASLGVLTA
jgi:hypothetical protein